jgi:hypothetical protein
MIGRFKATYFIAMGGCSGCCFSCKNLCDLNRTYLFCKKCTNPECAETFSKVAMGIAMIAQVANVYTANVLTLRNF